MRSRLSAERVIGALLAAFAAVFAVVTTRRADAFDLASTLKLQAWRYPGLTGLMRAASWPGFPPQSRIIPPVIIGAWLAVGERRKAAFQLASWGGAALSTGIKAVVRRPRPLPPEVKVVIAPLGGTSFPSGHVLTYVGFYGFLGFLLAEHLHHGPLRAASVASLAGMLALVGPSRIQQGHHWTTDVVASYVLGLAYVLALVELYHLAERR
jgi:membrane-associated phospholipid phosphatase